MGYDPAAAQEQKNIILLTSLSVQTSVGSEEAFEDTEIGAALTKTDDMVKLACIVVVLTVVFDFAFRVVKD